ncbi:efflux RND transporter permease subunit [Nitrosophilus kaiyonis]|uniref:efflux RND transporter permease subunit n=1 Tax=Nitrosophilus kaiyonis TaxID=2930200 RepID=UPI002493CC05|nr:efflux RND transporter permease subunit [Nitrosophilus kaiyonis]
MFKKFIEFAIDKPSLNHIFLIFIFILSIFAYINVPKEIFPPVSLNKILITGSYPGASAENLDQMVVKNLEDSLKNVNNLSDIDTIVKNGRFTIVSDIKEGADDILVLNDVKDQISKIKRDLPSDMDEPVATVLEKSFPLVLIAIAYEGDKRKLLDVADELKSKLSNIKELREITIRGDSDEELDILIDEEKIRAYGLNFLATVEALKNLSSIFPIGNIKEKGNHLYITTQNGKKIKKEWDEIVLKIQNKKVFLKDIAKIKFTLADPTQLSHFNGKQNVSLNVTKSKNGNAIKLVKHIKNILKEFKKRYPEFTFQVYTDTSIWIRNRLNTVTSNLLFGLLLVFISLLLTVNYRIALVVGMGIPVSFMIGLIALEIFGYSLNMLSLLGALIALGMLVDEAIVVAENIYRHLENGENPRDATIIGTIEMFPAVLTATATTIFAFLPLLIMSGEMGNFIKILPIMISILLLSSLFEAFYFLPLHAKDILKVKKSKKENSSFWKKMGEIYEKILGFLLKRKYIALVSIISLILISTFIMLKKSKFQLFPEFDTTQIYVSGRVNVNNDIFETEKIVSNVEKDILKNIKKDEVKSVTTIVGMKLDAKNNAEQGENLFHIFINLHEPKPKNFVDKYITPYFSFEYDSSDMIRDRVAKDIAKDIKKIVEKYKKDKEFEEINVIVPQAGIVKSDIELSLVYQNNEDVLKAIEIIEKNMKNIDGVFNITDDAYEGEKELKLKLNRYAQELGIDENYLYLWLRPLYLKGEFSKMFKDEKLFRIRFESLNKDKFEKFKNLEIDIPNSNQKVFLKDIAEFVYKKHFYTLIKENGDKIRTIYASLDKKKITSDEFYDKMSPILNEVKKMGINIIIKGEQKENKKVKREIGEAAIIALFLIFISLVWMFNSVIKSLIVLSSIPLSIFGVLLGHKLMGINLTMPSLIGIVGLAGVVVNDGLIMLDFIKNCKNISCVVEKAKLRLRPILLTSITTILGLSTLMFFASGQSLILQPMAITLGFGLAWATIINLYIVPLFFSSIYRIKG